MRRRAVALVAGILSIWAGAAWAQPAKRPPPPSDPAALSEQAESRAAAGDYVGAAASFLAAYALEPRPEYLCNVGVAYQRAMVWPRAHAFLGECIAQGTELDAEFVGLVKEALTEVEATLRAGDYAPIEIAVVPATAVVSFSTFSENEKLPGSRTVWMPVGSHAIVAEAPGYVTTKRDIVVVARTSQRVPIALAKPGPVGPDTVDPPADKSMVPAIFATSVTVAVGAAAVVTYIKARSTANKADATDITRADYDGLIDDARQWKHISWGLTGAAIVGAGVSSFLWYRYASSPSTLEVAPTTNGAAISVTTRW